MADTQRSSMEKPERILGEIDRQRGVPHHGRIVQREAVRGIILRDQSILLVHSSVEGDYKFPGGGVEEGEAHFTALRREIAEESGAELLAVKKGLGQVIEFAFPIEKGFDAFKMTSFYYLCEISPHLREQHLSDYEADLGFTPVWVKIDPAIHNNQKILEGTKGSIPRWVRRETLVLQIVRDELINVEK
jgi:8-oxo-dGTP diphosphatase